MTIELEKHRHICVRCGLVFSKRNGVFIVNHSNMYKGIGYIPVCKDCLEQLYNTYLAQCNDPKGAVRQVCRKLDLFWDQNLFESIMAKSTKQLILFQYIAKLNTGSYIGKCYDDTLSNEGTLWNFASGQLPVNISEEVDDESGFIASDEIKAFWGAEYSNSMYEKLEQRRAYYMAQFPEGTILDMGSEILLRQICNLEVSIACDSAAGKPIDKSVNTLNTILGSLNLKPVQKKETSDSNYDNTPFGVWIRRFEDERPIPDVDPELEDPDGIKKYITVWFFGHLCKMLGIRNSYCRLYEEEIEKMRVENPEFEDEEDDDMLADIFGDGDGDE